MQILVVEDEKKLAGALQKGLEAEKYLVRVVHTGEEAFFLVSTEHFDLLLLDIMLPGRDGLDILKALRQKDFALPVLILTSKDAVEDRVRGLKAGADDYLVKPFAFPELLARVEAIARRSNRTEVTSAMRLADLEAECRSVSISRSASLICNETCGP